MALFRKRKGIKLNSLLEKQKSHKHSGIPEDLFGRCPKCRKILVQNQMDESKVCSHCEYHLQFPALERIHWLTDENSFEEWDRELTSNNPIDFPDYEEKIEKTKKKTGLNEAVVTGYAKIGDQPLAIGVMDSRFVMASMGTVVGEKLVRLFENATHQKLPVVLFVASGGARMQEGILSLMQMAKVSQAVSEHSNEGLFYLPVLTHPTTGGVTASFAMQGDMILAEPDATIGFAGRRVIEQTIKSQLPVNFQKAETVLENGFIDNIIERKEQREIIDRLIYIHS